MLDNLALFFWLTFELMLGGPKPISQEALIINQALVYAHIRHDACFIIPDIQVCDYGDNAVLIEYRAKVINIQTLNSDICNYRFLFNTDRQTVVAHSVWCGDVPKPDDFQDLLVFFNTMLIIGDWLDKHESPT